MDHIKSLHAAGKIKDYQVLSKKQPHAARGQKKLKYGNKKTVVDGIEFDSMKEAKRFGDLMLMLKAGEIALFERQVEFELQVNGKKVASYIADFVYLDMATGEKAVEDVKSVATRKLPVYRLKKKLMKSIHGIEIREV